MKTGRGSILLLLHLLFLAAARGQTVPIPDVLWVARERAESINCLNQLKLIGLAARTWQVENGEFPSGFSVLTNQLGTPGPLFCPSHYRREPTPTNWSGFVWEAIDYEWVTVTNQADPAPVFCRCKIHPNVARTDGSADLIRGFRPGWPRILAPPLSQFATTGSLVRFEFVLTNAALPIHLQWNREDPFWRTNVMFVVLDDETGEGYWRTNRVGTNTPIPGATNAMFEIGNAGTNDSGYYSVTISNSQGTAKTSLHRLQIPPPSTQKPLAEVLCISRLKSIYLAAQLWAADHADNLPLHFNEITNDIGYPLFGWPVLLYCPADTNRIAPASWTSVNFTNTSYELLQTNAMPESYDEPFARCRVHGFVVLGDGTVEPALTVNSDSVVRTNEQLRFTVRNPTNRRFEIEASTNLVDWANLLTITNTASPFSFTDPTTNFHRRFYRARLAD
jgi:hypothetical protein